VFDVVRTDDGRPVALDPLAGAARGRPEGAALLGEEDQAGPAVGGGLRGPSPVDTLSGLLATNGLDDPAVRGLLDELGAGGLVEERDGVVSLTADGTARYTHLRDRLETVTTRIFEDYDATRVETARSLLQEIAQTDPDQLTRRSVPTG
jgi:hypothetical protein